MSEAFVSPEKETAQIARYSDASEKKEVQYARPLPFRSSVKPCTSFGCDTKA